MEKHIVAIHFGEKWSRWGFLKFLLYSCSTETINLHRWEQSESIYKIFSNAELFLFSFFWVAQSLWQSSPERFPETCLRPLLLLTSHMLHNALVTQKKKAALSPKTKLYFYQDNLMLEQCCPVEFSAIMAMFYICAVKYNSHWPCGYWALETWLVQVSN